jgi:Mn2+/Fe2+ NRAMP family transporter
VKSDWGAVAFRSVIPYFHWSTDYVLNVVGNNKRVMGEHVNSRSVGLLGWAITIIMGCCAAALISGQVT